MSVQRDGAPASAAPEPSPAERAQELVSGSEPGARAIAAALAAGGDLRPLAEALAPHLDTLTDETLELALQVINRARVPAFDAWLERQLADASETSATHAARTRRAARALWIAAGARDGVRYTVAPKPALHDARIWPVLLDIVASNRDPELSGQITTAATQALSYVSELDALLPRLRELRQRGDQAWVADALRLAAVRGRDVASALEPGDVTAWIADALNRGDAQAAIERWVARTESRTMLDVAAQTVAKNAPMGDALCDLLAVIAEDSDALVRKQAVQGAARVAQEGHRLGAALERAMGTMLAHEVTGSRLRGAPRLADLAACVLGEAIGRPGGEGAHAIAQQALAAEAAPLRVRAAQALSIGALLKGDLAVLRELATQADASIRLGVAKAAARTDYPHPEVRAEVCAMLAADKDLKVRKALQVVPA